MRMMRVRACAGPRSLADGIVRVLCWCAHAAPLVRRGYSIGQRLVEEFLALSRLGKCRKFRDTVDVIALVGLKMYLGVTANVVWHDEANTDCRLVLTQNPLAEFVELPPAAVGSLYYSNVLCGVLRGALEMLGMIVICEFTADALFGASATEIRLYLTETKEDKPPKDDD